MFSSGKYFCACFIGETIAFWSDVACMKELCEMTTGSRSRGPRFHYLASVRHNDACRKTTKVQVLEILQMNISPNINRASPRDLQWFNVSRFDLHIRQVVRFAYDAVTMNRGILAQSLIFARIHGGPISTVLWLESPLQSARRNYLLRQQWPNFLLHHRVALFRRVSKTC